MQVDDDLCLCFHVSWRKVLNYIRVERVTVPSQLSQCQSAGTGCGWCRAAMVRLVKRMQTDPPLNDDWQSWLDAAASDTASGQHAAGRQRYIAEGRGTPPA